MTRQSTKQHGVSLVEVVLTLAISSLLITTVLAGRNSIRSTAQFSDGMERIKETILSTKSQANTGNNTTGNGTAQIAGVTNKTYLLMGQSLLFNTAAATTMQDANVLCYGQDLLCGGTLTSEIKSQRNSATPWNIKYQGYTTAASGATPKTGYLSLVFGRNDQNGAFEGAWFPGVIKAGVLRTAAFANKDAVTLHFASQDGRSATVTVNPVTGTVTRTIQ